MNESLQGKRILIVGGGSGIGLALAGLAARRGASVAVASRNPAAHKEAFAGFPEGSCTLLRLDVTDPDAPAPFFEALGEIDHLAITVRPEISPAPFRELNMDQARRAFDTKLFGPMLLIRAACGNIREGGSISTVSGIAGEKIYPGAAVISLINSALETLCKVLSVELAPLRVNAVSSGFVAPKAPAVEKMAEGFPAGRLAAPEEVASAFLYLMQNPYVTGTVLTVDGGASLV